MIFGLVQILKANSAIVCIHLLILCYFNSLNLILTGYSGITARRVPCGTLSVAVNGSAYI